MGSGKQAESKYDLTEIILATLRGAEDGRTMKVKTLRKHVLMSAYQSSEEDVENDKLAKKQFKKTIQALEASPEKLLSLTEDGIVTLHAARDHKPKKKSVKKKDDKKKRRMALEQDDDQQETDDNKKLNAKKTDARGEIANSDSNDQQTADDEDHQDQGKNTPCEGNPMGCTRLFIGNLPFAVDDVALSSHLAPAETTHIKWISDKETGRFYGSAFVEIIHSRDAAMVVTKLNGSQLMGRAIKINYAPARPGDVWPPTSKVVTGGQAGTAKGVTSMSEKPPECKKLFVGNLSYEIDDDAIYNFFSAVDAEVRAVRWLSHRETGDFKGCGFVEFWTPEACDKGATLNGKNLLGRPIRIDWTE